MSRCQLLQQSDGVDTEDAAAALEATHMFADEWNQ